MNAVISNDVQQMMNEVAPQIISQMDMVRANEDFAKEMMRAYQKVIDNGRKFQVMLVDFPEFKKSVMNSVKLFIN